jgi:putative nucleotidyltransferase with HDIG domain
LVNELQSVVCVPLIAEEQTIGALIAGGRANIKKEEVHLLKAIGEIAAIAIHRLTLHEKAVQQMQHLAALHEIDVAISSSLDLRLSLKVLLGHVTKELGADAAAVLLMQPPTQTLTYAAGQGFRTREIEQARIKPGEGCAGRAALERAIVSVPDNVKSNTMCAHVQLLKGEAFVSHHVAPLIVKGRVKGVLEVFHRSPLVPDAAWMDFFEALAGQAAIAVDSATLFNDLQHANDELVLAYDATIEGWSNALDLRDKETEGHSQRVTVTTVTIARAMGIGDDDLVHVRRGALLHDIGKMGIPDNILLKPGKLTDEEWNIMRNHPVFAYKLLSPIAFLKAALDIPYYHHEKWDGAGYPHGLKGEQIPLAARIFAVVDVWDALGSDRPYRPAWPKEKMLRYLRDESGKHFDPKVVEIFIKLLEDTASTIDH